jgi:hypothetical protein
MNYDTATIDQNVAHEAGAIISQSSNVASRVTSSRKRPAVAVHSEPTWKERFKKALAALSQVFEGDQEYHKYFRM